MDKHTKSRVLGLCNSVIMVADVFIGKCKTGRARSVETLDHMIKIKNEALELKTFVKNH